MLRVALLASLLVACDRSPPPAPNLPSAPLPVAPPLGASSAAAVPSAVASAPKPRVFDPSALPGLREEAERTASDALIVIHDGRVETEWYRGAAPEPIQSMSITKSVLALLVGCLVAEQKLRVEQPVHELFPEWSSERQRQVTIFHLLTHSSGIHEGESTSPIYAARSFVGQALSSPIEHEPGTHYEYGNRASNLLAGVIARAAKQPTEAVARRCLFEPLGITRTIWSRDRAGQAHGLAGLHLLPRDLAKLGELLLAEGEWQGRRVLDRAWVRRILHEAAPIQPPHKRLGLLFWRVAEWTERSVTAEVVAGWRAGGVEPALALQLAKLEGTTFRSGLELVKAMRAATGDAKLAEVERQIWKRKLPDASYRFGPIVGTSAVGSLGQYLVVLPEERVVAVRMRKGPSDRAERKDLEKTFPDFPDRVVGLSRRQH